MYWRLQIKGLSNEAVSWQPGNNGATLLLCMHLQFQKKGYTGIFPAAHLTASFAVLLTYAAFVSGVCPTGIYMLETNKTASVDYNFTCRTIV